MAELDLGAYFEARGSLLEALPGLVGPDADLGLRSGDDDGAMERVEEFFRQADGLAETIIAVGRQRTARDVEPGAGGDGDDAGPTPAAGDANEEGDQFCALVGDVLSILNDTVVAAIGPDREYGRLDFGPEQFALTRLGIHPWQERSLYLAVNDLPALLPVERSRLATFERNAPAPFTQVPPTPGGDVAPPGAPGAGAPNPDVMIVAEEIFDKTGVHVGSAILGGAASGLLDIINAGALVTEVVARASEGHGPLVVRIIRRAAASLAGWIVDLFEVAGELVSEAADRLVGRLRHLQVAIGMPLVCSWIGLDHERTMMLLEAGLVPGPGFRSTQAVPSSVRRSFERRMRHVENGGRAASLITALALAAPGSGLVIGLVSTLLTLWLASDHLGVESGLFEGRPNWHHPDLGS